MKYIVVILSAFLFACLWQTQSIYAVENPIAVANNKVGIHILFPHEIADAAKLINANGGEWGYVIIPIQSGDRDLLKWQQFMDDARKLKVIPIIRIATEGDYFNTKVWRKPTDADVLDFANFLSSLSWPTKNKYVVIFNEVNRADEWGGDENPAEYAQLLSYAVSVFKSKNPDFFIISAGFDNASANTSESTNPYDFMRGMHAAVPGIFLQIDGWGSHSYPNPAFAKPPSQLDAMSIATYKYELDLIASFGGRSLPVFITETGWSGERIAPEVIGSYMHTAFTSVWSDTNVIAVTPFILKAGSPFDMFSFMQSDDSPSPQYKSVYDLPKIKGTPRMSPVILGESIPKKNTPVKAFSSQKSNITFAIPTHAKTALKWFLQMPLE